MPYYCAAEDGKRNRDLVNEALANSDIPTSTCSSFLKIRMRSYTLPAIPTGTTRALCWYTTPF